MKQSSAVVHEERLKVSNETGTDGASDTTYTDDGSTNACTFHHARIKPQRTPHILLDIHIKLQKYKWSYVAFQVHFILIHEQNVSLFRIHKMPLQSHHHTTA